MGLLERAFVGEQAGLGRSLMGWQLQVRDRCGAGREARNRPSRRAWLFPGVRRSVS